MQGHKVWCNDVLNVSQCYCCFLYPVEEQYTDPNLIFYKLFFHSQYHSSHLLALRGAVLSCDDLVLTA